MLNLIKVLAAMFLVMLMAIVDGVGGVVVLSPLYTLQFITLSDIMFVL